MKPPPPQNRRKRGGKGEFITGGNSVVGPRTVSGTATPDSTNPAPTPTLDASSEAISLALVEPPPQLSNEEAIAKISQMEPLPDPNTVIQSENLYCPECYLPLHPDPKPEKLYIFLHALKYTTSLGAYKTEMPEWAAEGYDWDRS